jgi:hypothetical protein
VRTFAEPSWWVRVAADFTPERLDEIETALLRLVDPTEAVVMRPCLHARHDAVVVAVGSMSRTDPRGGADAAYAILVAAVDLADPEGDVPFCRLLCAGPLLDHPELGARLSRRWWDHQCDAHLNLRPLSAAAFAVSAYGVAAFMGLVGGRDAELRAWLQTAAETTEFEGPPGVVLVVRAARLL